MSTPLSDIELLSDSTLERLLAHLRTFPARGREDGAAVVRRWLRTTSAGSALIAYLADEAALIAAAADRLNISGDDDLREMAAELGNAADRVRHLAGVPAAQPK